MQPVIVTFRHLDRSEALVSRAREMADALSRINDRISQCQVVVEGHHHGPPYLVRVELRVPGAHIHAANTQIHGMPYIDPYTAMHRAFAEARRQLVDLGKRRRRDRSIPDPGEHREDAVPDGS